MKEIKSIKLLKVFEIKKDYLIYVFENKDTYELYLSNKNYGILELVFGLEKSATNIEIFLNEYNLKELFKKDIEVYKEKYED